MAERVRTSQRWFVTGCSAGLGRRICEVALERGDSVVATARHVSQLQRFKEIGNDRVVILPLDVTNQDAIRSAVAAGTDAFGGIDILVNNAGAGTVAALEESSDDDLDRIIGTNLLGTVAVTRAFLPHFRKNRSGRIIVVGSGSAVGVTPTVGLYLSTKYGQEGLFAVLAQEVAHLGIKATVVSPGSFRSDWRFRTMTRSENRIDDYRSISDPVREVLDKPYSETSGDPRDFAQWLLDVTDSPAPPLRLPMGPDSWSRTRQGLEQRLRELGELERDWKPRQTPGVWGNAW